MTKLFPLPVVLLAGLAAGRAQSTPPLETHSVGNRTTYIQVVNPFDPALQWAAPASIGFGTPVDATQLNATANTGGTFLYNPAAGQILEPGTHPLVVIFTPSNPNFPPLQASVALTVRSPQGATFHFSSADFSSVQTVAAPRTSYLFHVTPVGDFFQPITFSCAAPLGYSCIFSPAVVRPTTRLLSVTMTLVRGRAANRPGPAAPSSVSLAAFAATLCAFFLRRRKRLPGLVQALLLTGTLYSVTGCGFTLEPVDTITVTATSLRESISVKVPFFQR